MSDVDGTVEQLRRELDRVTEEKEVMEAQLDVVRDAREAALVCELDERRALGRASANGAVPVHAEVERLRDERNRAVGQQTELKTRLKQTSAKAERLTEQLKDALWQLDRASKERLAAEEALEEAKEQLAAAGGVSHGTGVYVGVVVVLGAALLVVWLSRRRRHLPALPRNSVSVQARAVGALGGSSTVELAVTNHSQRPISIVDVQGGRRDGRRCEYVVHERLPIRVEARGTPSFQLQRDRRFGAADFVRVAVAALPFGVDGGSYTVFSTDLPQPDRQLEAVPVIDGSCIMDDRTFPARAGAYGIVTKAKYKRSGGRAPVVVAVKKPHAETFMSEKARQQLRLEAQHQYTLGLHHHDFVVQLVGIVEARRGVWLVMEWTDKGSLRQQLIDHDDDIGVRRRLEWAKQIAEAVRMVHDEQVVHCDLALRNVLLFDGNTVKLADFGLSRVTHDGVRVTLGGNLPTDVFAPEVHDGTKRQYTASSDVYSFGILLWDLFSPMDQNAFPSDVRGGQSIGEFVKGGGRPAELTVETCACRKEMPVELLEALTKLMKRCWAQEPSDRPGMAEVADELGAMLTSCTVSLSSMPDSVDEDEEQDELKAASSADDATDDEVDADEVDAGKDADGGPRGVYIGDSSS